MVLMILYVLQPEIKPVTHLQLEVYHRLFGDQHTICMTGQCRQSCLCIPSRKKSVGHIGRFTDMRRIDPKDVLQIVADVGKPVLH